MRNEFGFLEGWVWQQFMKQISRIMFWGRDITKRCEETGVIDSMKARNRGGQYMLQWMIYTHAEN